MTTPLTPPTSWLARLRAQLTTCRTTGHTYRLAFPLGRLGHQCVHCGDVAPPMVLRSTERYVARVGDQR